MEPDIRIKECTSNSEAMRLAEILDLQHTDRVRGDREKLQRGSISTSGQVGTDIAVARIREKVGQRIVLVASWNIPFLRLPDLSTIE